MDATSASVSAESCINPAANWTRRRETYCQIEHPSALRNDLLRWNWLVSAA